MKSVRKKPEEEEAMELASTSWDEVVEATGGDPLVLDASRESLDVNSIHAKKSSFWPMHHHLQSTNCTNTKDGIGSLDV